MPSLVGSEMCIRDRGGTTHSPAAGGRCLAENAYQNRKQNNVLHKGKKTKHTALRHCVSSQITLVAPRLGAEEGVGRTTSKTNTKNPQPRAYVSRPDYPDHGPVLSGGGRRDGRKANRQVSRDHPGPSTERGGQLDKIKIIRTNQAASPITQETLQTLKF